MMADSRPGILNTSLDPGILSTPFKVQTNWHVITGASCSGKTTMINLLAGVGFKTVPEASRTYIEVELAKGRTLEGIRADRAAFTRTVYNLMMTVEQGNCAPELTFLDRALPDGLAFFRFAGIDPNTILPDCFQYRYASVFMLDRFPYQRDGVRVADDPTAEWFDTWIERDYRSLGYCVVRVPVLPPEERLSFVLEKLSDEGWV